MTTIFLKMLLEAMKAMVGKMMFSVVSERFLSRMVCLGLRKIAAKSTNDFTREAAEAMIDGLKRPDLPKIK
ncbi:hypothetical protein GZ77_03885 [Endozoicomonas montiporae]|uniref:Uncharacterized protein n=2 Tax=Endozoicomonas montiporae TaxID=1027273 RepID=A0A081NB93_9GAMM|nr:hypothetical protein [Endozoicomonas montiporae]AMO56557.1 hypothetical protein EZMO1_2473 [Endozoicomonas montiporae CL-33]KEQ15716.1 hypothetical protein GZ77_03885 [Endozoicomonas montiporae]